MGHHQIKRNNCVKREPAEQEEAFAGHPSDRGLMLEQIKKKLTNNMSNYLINTKANRQISKDKIQIANKKLKCSASLAIREISKNYSEIPSHTRQNGSY